MSDIDVRICVLQRGRVQVGYYERQATGRVRLWGARTIRRWGTPGKGLEHLCKNGPTSTTKIDDAAPFSEWHELVEVHTLGCDAEIWREHLPEPPEHLRDAS